MLCVCIIIYRICEKFWGRKICNFITACENFRGRWHSLGSMQWNLKCFVVKLLVFSWICNGKTFSFLKLSRIQYNSSSYSSVCLYACMYVCGHVCVVCVCSHACKYIMLLLFFSYTMYHCSHIIYCLWSYRVALVPLPITLLHSVKLQVSIW